MAGQEIKYKVTVDSSRANRALDQFGRAAQDAGRTAITALDDTASAGDQARAALEAMAQAMESEMKDAAQAAEALGKALGPELAGKLDPAAIVGDLNKMGVSFDEIRADADKFADTLKKINTVDLGKATGEVDNLDSHIDSAKTGIGNMDESATNAKGALANMIGNSAQDVSGLSGSLGVAIGQMAEYSADAILAGKNSGQAFKEMATVAGPIAGLALITAGIAAVKSNLADLAAQQKKYTEDLTALQNAFIDTGDVADVLDTQIRDNVLFDKPGAPSMFQQLMDDLPLVGGQLEEQKKLWEDVGDPLTNMVAALDNAGISFNELTAAAKGGGDGMANLRIELAGLETDGKITEEQFDFLDEQLSAYQETLFAVEKQSTLTGRVMTSSQGDVTAAMQANNDELTRQSTLWDFVLDDLKDGKADTIEATSAWNQLRDTLKLTDDQMAELAKQKLDEKLEADKAAALNVASAVADMRQAVDDYNTTVSSADFGAAAFEGATTAAQGFFDTALIEESQIADSQAAYDDLTTAIDAAGTTFMDLNSPEGRQTFGLLKQLGSTIVPKVAQAYADADGDLEQFKSNMHVVGEETITGLIGSFTDLGYSTDQARSMANDLMIQLGLIPENVETLYKLAGTEEAKLQLGLLQGVIGTLTQPQQIHIATLITHGDYVGARDYLESIMGPPVTVKVQPEIDWYAVSREKGQLQNAFSSGIKVTVSPRSAGPSSSAAAAPMTAATRGVAPAAMAAPVPVTVNVRAAVIGNRFDVERVVAGAVRNAVRIAGRRQLAGVA